LRSKKTGNLVVGPKGGKLKAGSAVAMLQCGSGTAKISGCAGEGKNGQWELAPMFVIEEGKRAVNCAPYSHSMVKPKVAKTRQQAQELCAADSACVTYNWAEAQPAGEGAVADTVFLCTEVHEVHPGMKGWQLGVRIASVEKFSEERRELDRTEL